MDKAQKQAQENEEAIRSSVEEDEEFFTADGKLPERERLVNIWRAEIEFFERLRRENGAAVIGVRLIAGPDHDADAVADYIIDSLAPSDLFTRFRHDIALIDVWGKDLNELFKICHLLRKGIPVVKNEPAFRLHFALVMGIPFSELHHNESLMQVLHKVLSLLHDCHDEAPDFIPYDHFMDMEKTTEQFERMKLWKVKRDARHSHEKKRPVWSRRSDADEQGYPNLQ